MPITLASLAALPRELLPFVGQKVRVNYNLSAKDAGVWTVATTSNKKIASAPRVALKDVRMVVSEAGLRKIRGPRGRRDVVARAEGVLEGAEPSSPAPVAYTFNPWVWDTFVTRSTPHRPIEKARRAIFLPDEGALRANATVLEGLRRNVCDDLRRAFRRRRMPAAVKAAMRSCPIPKR